MSNIPLRYYQNAAIDAIYTYFINNKGNPIVGLPTGTGKSVVIAAFVAGVLQRWPKQRILILTHRKELITQNSAKLLEVWPEAPIGIFSAGLGDKTYWMPVTFGGVGSVYRGLDKFYQAFDLILIDECHLISPAGFGMYGTVLAHFQGLNPKVKVIGFTATAYRLKQGMLTDATYSTDGEAIPALFTDIIYDLTDIDGFLKLVNDGFLCKPIVRPTHTVIDISGVKVQAGEFNQKQLEKAVDIQAITEAACNEIIWYGQQRWAWLVFGTSIDHAEHIASTMQQKGVACEAVHSKLKGKIADERLEAFKRGELRCLVNNDKLTTGFDHPPVDLIGMLRHTMSPSLWVQMVGRGTRPYDFQNPALKYIPGYDFRKQNCLVLDFARNIERLGPINDPVLPKTKTGKKGDMPVKLCPQCGIYNFGAARFCDECGHEFEFQTHIEHSSDGNSVIFRDNEPVVERYSVIQAAYKKYRRNDTSVPMMFCTYICVDTEGKPKNIRENVLFEHDGFARKKAEAWFAQRHPTACPLTVDEAMKFHPYFRTPKAIRVRTDQQYPEVLAAEF